MTPRPFRFLPHTADLLVEARGRDLPELFARCVDALFSLISDRRYVRPRETRTAEVRAATREEQLYLLLRAALLLFSADRFLVRNARVTMKNDAVALSVAGEPSDFARHPIGREVKAVTAHALTVREARDGVVARFVVDI